MVHEERTDREEIRPQYEDETIGADPSSCPETEGDESIPESAACDAAAADGEDKIAELEKQIEELKNQRLLLAADFDNYRKRSARQMEDTRKFALEKVMLDLLEVVDNLERAIGAAEKSGAPEDDPLLSGIRNVHRQFLTVLSGYGLEAVSCDAGGEFDPAVHEAVMNTPSDKPEGTILNVFKKGYILNGRVVRPAHVNVASED